MIHHLWRLSEGGDNNLGLTFTSDALLLGRTPLVERRDNRFVVREQSEIAFLLGKAYKVDLTVDRLMSGLAAVASALNANDPCLARIAAVHLKLPDLPDEAARDSLKAADTLIKYDDWNPALHPRAGTPPNPGWFAPTGSEDNDSASDKTAQNDDPNRQSDASPAPADNWVRLPAGPKRIDELSDFIEWLANATPADEQTIRAEIKRYFYDAGDQGSAAMLNSALSAVLRPSVTQQHRQQILDSLDVYTRADPKEYAATRDWTTGAAILAGTLPPGAVGEAVSGEAASEDAAAAAASNAPPSEAWKWGWAKRGREIHDWLSDGSLGPYFPTIDMFSNGLATSIKSIDLNAATYQNSISLTYRLNSYVDKLSEFSGARWGADVVDPADISNRTLNLVVPKGSMTEMQRSIINAARVRGESMNSRVRLTITEL